MVSEVRNVQTPRSTHQPQSPKWQESLQARLERFESRSHRRRGMPVVCRESADSQPLTIVDPAFIQQAAWVARVLATSRPKRHTDISFSPALAATVSAFVPVDFYTPRPSSIQIPGVKTGLVDLDRLPFRDASIASVSCTGIIERAGLGNDGDELNPDADLDAMHELKRVLAPDGSLLFICPIGKPRVLFDSHRVYSFGQVLDAFDGLDLDEFSLIPGDGPTRGLLVNPDERLTNQQTHGYGCFWLRKPL